MIPLTFALLPANLSGQCKTVDNKSFWVYNTCIE